MKTLLQFLLNLILFIMWIIGFLGAFIWYGKLPKVSPYHHFKSNFMPNTTFNDELAQSREFPAPISLNDKMEVLNELMRNERCRKHLSADVLVFNIRGEEAGYKPLLNLFQDTLKNNK